jgi:hypothetical protein
MIETKISSTIEALAKALSLAQGAMKDSPRSGKGNYGKYSTLADCLDVLRDVLTKNGLSVVQLPKVDEFGCHLETILMHTSGQLIQSTLSCKPVSLDPQKIGSAITYMRRYSLSAILGLAPEDDDGESASNLHRGPQPADQKPPVNPQAQTYVPATDTYPVDNYVIDFGKFKGKTLQQVAKKDLINYADWLEADAVKKGQPISDRVKFYINKVKGFCLEKTQEDMPQFDPNDIPF